VLEYFFSLIVVASLAATLIAKQKCHQVCFAISLSYILFISIDFFDSPLIYYPLYSIQTLLISSICFTMYKRSKCKLIATYSFILLSMALMMLMLIIDSSYVIFYDNLRYTLTALELAVFALGIKNTMEAKGRDGSVYINTADFCAIIILMFNNGVQIVQKGFKR